jgi:hypothetical protein
MQSALRRLVALYQYRLPLAVAQVGMVGRVTE